MTRTTADSLLAYKIFCLEGYKSKHRITGQEAYAIFKKHTVFDYLSKFYDELHSTGLLYAVADIDDFIANRPLDTH
ncbi:MAG: DUF3791 domain-containing protein [Treponema sp.]|jgi:hypothetical protein|nr:DUF3791 domain-containing protein [Treponema sp.]